MLYQNLLRVLLKTSIFFRKIGAEQRRVRLQPHRPSPSRSNPSSATCCLCDLQDWFLGTSACNSVNNTSLIELL